MYSKRSLYNNVMCFLSSNEFLLLYKGRNPVGQHCFIYWKEDYMEKVADPSYSISKTLINYVNI